jgi:transposase
MAHKQSVFDYRKLSLKQKAEVRITSVRRVIQGKEMPTKVAEEYGYNIRNIFRWIQTYRLKGYKGLEAGKPSGRPLELTKIEINKLKKWLSKDPRQLKFHFGLWTVQMVRKLVKDKFGKEYALSGMHNLLKSLGYTYQKPLLRAIQQNPQAVETWKKEEYPKIRSEAKREKRNIYFSDESGFQSIHNKSKTWGIKGERPVVEHTGRRFSKGVISAITPQGKLRFMQYDGGMDSELFIKFLERLQAGEKKKITLILDGLPVHKSKAVKEYVEKTEGKIKVYFLPSYSPGLNPDELVWSVAKGHISKTLVRTKAELERHISTFLHSIQKRKGFIQRLFEHDAVAYINGV